MVDVAPHVLAAERLLELPENFSSNTDFGECIESLRRGESATFDSVWGSSCALLCASLSKHFSNLLIVVPDGKSQDDLLDDLPTFFAGLIERFPACLPGADSGLTIDLEYGDRLRLTKSLIGGDLSDYRRHGSVSLATCPIQRVHLRPFPTNFG